MKLEGEGGRCPWCVLFLIAQAEGVAALPPSPLLGASRTGTGRQTGNRVIVRRHSLDRLNASKYDY